MNYVKSALLFGVIYAFVRAFSGPRLWYDLPDFFAMLAGYTIAAVVMGLIAYGIVALIDWDTNRRRARPPEDR